MMFNVPQFIDVEDKIAGPLTWRQLLWMIGMGAALLVFFNMFDPALFFIIAVPTVLLFVGLAFYRPNGIPLVVYIFHAILFIFRPKVAVWERPVRRIAVPTRKEQEHMANTVSQMPADKHVTAEKLKELARILDSRGK
jgi:hypothetical protein